MAEIGRINAARLLPKESGVGLASGALRAFAVGLVVGPWFDNAALETVFGIALVFDLLAATLAGTLVPIALDRFGSGPVRGRTIVVTAVADIPGFVSYLGLATLRVV